MYLCYFDESGDPGYTAGSPTKTYALGALIIHEDCWLSDLDDLVRFRRFLRDQFGFPMKAELKANYLMRNGGPFRRLGIGDDMRRKIFRMALELPGKLGRGQGAKVFAVVCDKDEMQRRGLTDDPRKVVWDRAMERLERFTSKQNECCMIFPDEGNDRFIRNIIREKRRVNIVPSRFYTGALSRPAHLIVEDPAFRTSDQSYFIQLADLIAYAAYRAVTPGAHIGSDSWETLGSARLSEVNMYAGKASGEPPALLVWPRTRKM